MVKLLSHHIFEFCNSYVNTEINDKDITKLRQLQTFFEKKVEEVKNKKCHDNFDMFMRDYDIRWLYHDLNEILFLLKTNSNQEKSLIDL